jgi:hypothetical protein
VDRASRTNRSHMHATIQVCRSMVNLCFPDIKEKMERAKLKHKENGGTADGDGNQNAGGGGGTGKANIPNSNGSLIDRDISERRETQESAGGEQASTTDEEGDCEGQRWRSRG